MRYYTSASSVFLFLILALLLAVPPLESAEKKSPDPVPSAPDPKVLRVYMSGDYMPLHGLRGQERIGMEAEIAEAVAAAMGKHVEYYDQERAGTSPLEAVATGRVDIALNAITPTPERAERVDFTETVADVPLRVAMASEASARGYEDSLGSWQKLAVPKGPLESQLVGEKAKRVLFDSLSEAVKSTVEGNTNAVVAEEPALVQAAAGAKMVILNFEVGRSPVAMAAPKGKKAEYDAVLRGIADKIALIRAKWGHYRASFLRVSVGRRTACALSDTRELACFGDQESLLTPPAGRFLALDVGAEHACAIREDYTVACWGKNEHGEAVPKPGKFKLVTAGVGHTCGVTQDGSLACWGDNRQGQANAPAGTYKTVNAGDAFSCALTADDRAVCWGRKFADIPAGPFKNLFAGPMGACAIGIRKQDKTVCWTEGKTTTMDTDFYMKNPQISLGFDIACGLVDRDYLPRCIGSPLSYVPDVPFFQIEAGQGMACGIRISGSLECWGNGTANLQQMRAAGGVVWNVTRASRSKSPFLFGICGNGGVRKEGLLHPELGVLEIGRRTYDESKNSTWYLCTKDGPKKITYPAECGNDPWIAATVPLTQKRVQFKTTAGGPGETYQELAACDIDGLPGSLWLSRYHFDPSKAKIDQMRSDDAEGGSGEREECSGLRITWRGSPGNEAVDFLDDCIMD